MIQHKKYKTIKGKINPAHSKDMADPLLGIVIIVQNEKGGHLKGLMLA